MTIEEQAIERIARAPADITFLETSTVAVVLPLSIG